MKNTLDQMDLSQLNLTLQGLREHYRDGDFTPEELFHCLNEVCERENKNNPAWIHLLSHAELTPYLEKIKRQDPETLPLYGVPFAIKDNIDLAGIATTAGCPGYSYTPNASAFVVEQLIAAGAVPLGKTNMDQFATGLVGLRSPQPWGPCHNTLNSEYIAGGSSSGSAVATAMQWVSFALGTDTAGSGRVPASLNNIVGLKPSRGLLSNSGVVPACKSLDCVSIFAASSADANSVFDAIAWFDPDDPFARKNRYNNGKHYFQPIDEVFTVGVPSDDQLNFFGNDQTERLFRQGVQQLKDIGAIIKSIDLTPFIDAAKLLYEGPWVAERYWSVGDFIDQHPDDVLPVIKTIISSGNQSSAVDAFDAQYRLQALQQSAQRQLADVDVVVTPTIGTIYKIAQIDADPIRLNANLGYYTNFMNLLDCAAITVPSGFYNNGVGFGITLFHRAFSDKRLLSIAARLQAHTDLAIGATQKFLQPLQVNSKPPKDFIDVVVCGAHLDGLPLNWQLRERGARLLQKTCSSPNYKLYALAGGPPYRPGMVRVNDGGTAIEVEVWRVPAANFGSFVAEIPSPLGTGKVELADGQWHSGFICDAIGLAGAKDITEYGSWRGYLQALIETE